MQQINKEQNNNNQNKIWHNVWCHRYLATYLWSLTSGSHTPLTYPLVIYPLVLLYFGYIPGG